MATIRRICTEIENDIVDLWQSYVHKIARAVGVGNIKSIIISHLASDNDPDSPKL